MSTLSAQQSPYELHSESHQHEPSVDDPPHWPSQLSGAGAQAPGSTTLTPAEAALHALP